MVKAHAEWRVLKHGPIERLEDNLWCVTGSLPGMSMKRVMTLVRLDDGGLVVHSAIALDDASMSEIESWGRPDVLLVPNGYHRLDAPAYLARYPGMRVLAPRGSRSKVEEVVRVDGDYFHLGDRPPIRLEHLDGIREAEGVLTVSSGPAATLVFNDAIFNMPHDRGLAGFILRHVTASTGGPRVSRLFRLLAVKDRAAFRGHLERLADTPGLTRIVVSHHERIADRPAETLRRVAASL